MPSGSWTETPQILRMSVVKQQNDDIEELKLKIQAERDRVEKEQVREKQRIDKVKRILNTNQSTPMHSDEEGDEGVQMDLTSFLFMCTPRQYRAALVYSS